MRSRAEVQSNHREGRLTRPDGRTVAWVESGSLDGSPILRLPGTPGSRHFVRGDQSPWLARNVRIISTERPGFGASSPQPGRSFHDHADDLAALLDEQAIDSLPVYGVSGAAPYLLALAAHHPGRVQAISVLVGAAPLEDQEADDMIGLNATCYRLVRNRDRVGLVKELVPVREAILADPLASFRDLMKTAPPADQAIIGDPGWQQMFTRGLTEALREGVDGWVDESFLMYWGWRSLDLTAVRASLTWWHGDHDRNAPLSAVRRLLAMLPAAELVVWPDAGHLAPYRHEGHVLDELLSRANR